MILKEIVDKGINSTYNNIVKFDEVSGWHSFNSARKMLPLLSKLG